MYTATEWEQKSVEVAAMEAEDLTLPSGMTIRARRPDPLQLALWGRVPMMLAGAAAETETSESAPGVAVEMAIFLRDLLVYCCVEPRASMTPGENEIHPRQIPQRDWTFIVNWAMRVEEARSLTGFRVQRGNDGDRDDGEGVRTAPIGADGDSRSSNSPGL